MAAMYDHRTWAPTERALPPVSAPRSAAGRRASGRSTSVDNLLSLLGRLDANLHDEFETWMDEDDQSVRRDLSAAVSRRHQIAHGLNEGIGEQRALEYVSTLTTVADWFVRRLNPHAQARPSHQIQSAK